jgi:hypothetical protein
MISFQKPRRTCVLNGSWLVAWVRFAGWRCCVRDGGRPSAAVLQEEAANHRELRRLRAGVVSVAEKAWHRPRQVWIVKASETEPLSKRRNA